MNKLNIQRPRRNRKSTAIRNLVREHHLSANDFIAPLFILEKNDQKEEIKSMPGQMRQGLHYLLEEISALDDLGIKSVVLFPCVPDQKKDSNASFALEPDNFYYKALRAVKLNFPHITLMTDVALDPYSSDGHDGLVDPKTGEIQNDLTLPLLSQMALLQAKCGADIIGPSDMMDGRIGYIRTQLDKSGYEMVSIMSYSAKYASSFYGPFRDALDSTPKKGDKLSYQMDYANAREAYREARLDIKEGADILMVKPGLLYLDVIYRLKQRFDLPIAAYNISGEYSMIKIAAINGLLDEKKAVLESLYAFKRAGADIILTYFAKDAAQFLKSR